MIAAILLFGILAGLDNLKVCSSVGLLPMGRGRRNWLALGFLFCEMAAPVIGIFAGRTVLAFAMPYGQLAGPVMTVICGAAVMASALFESGEHSGETRWLFGLPVSLSLDNLLAGAGMSALPVPVWSAALGIGMVSGVLSCIGLYGAACIRRFVPARMDFAIGLLLCLIAMRMLIVDRI